MVMDKSFQEQHILNLMQAHVQDQNSEFAQLTEKAQSMVNVSAVLFGLVGLLNITQNAGLTPLLLMVLAVWVGIFIFSYLVIRPSRWDGGPLNPTWEETQRVLAKDPEAFYDWLVASYVDTIEKNSRVLTKKARMVSAAVLLVGVDVLVVIAGTILLG